MMQWSQKSVQFSKQIIIPNMAIVFTIHLLQNQLWTQNKKYENTQKNSLLIPGSIQDMLNGRIAQWIKRRQHILSRTKGIILDIQSYLYYYEPDSGSCLSIAYYFDVKLTQYFNCMITDCYAKHVKCQTCYKQGQMSKILNFPFMYVCFVKTEKNTVYVKIILIVMKGEHVDDVGTYLSF